MADYKITRVSSKAPREWAFTDKRTGAQIKMESYHVMVEGETDAVEVNRKPGDVPVVGETLTGSLERNEFGLKFKKENKPYTAGKTFQPKDEAAIKAMWAIGQAISFLSASPETMVLTDVEPLARDLFNMVDRVKTGGATGIEKAAAAAQQLRESKPVVTAFGKQVEDVDLSEIPF